MFLDLKGREVFKSGGKKVRGQGGEERMLDVGCLMFDVKSGVQPPLLLPHENALRG